eukprot:TRINITY_DN1337_c0_g1_i1.p1 TRINITY_DN1337_c0_g1~~TRINITY_DN1337_c0_g1_i1.p1  ORF type:complete len:254 (-),score=58.77 TRINITY_DN1337_c0_g1_i1:285-1016(-)
MSGHKRARSNSTAKGKRSYKEGRPSPAKRLKKEEKKVIVVIESATLETVSLKNSYELLNCDDHQRIMKRNKRDFSLARPDISHQMLMMLFDSPLNKAGHLQVYLRTNKNVLVEINPQTRIPRTYKRFAGLMVQLLHEMKITAATGGEEGKKTLMKVIKNPVTKYFPIGTRCVGTSSKAELVELDTYVAALPNDPIVFVLGGISKGKIDTDYTTEFISFSRYPLSGAVACAKLCNAFEKKWGIL